MEVDMSTINNDKLHKAAVSFLENDFNQCFEQDRHYDSQVVDIFFGGFHFYWYPFDHFKTVSFESYHFFRIIRKESDRCKPKASKYLCANTIIP